MLVPRPGACPPCVRRVSGMCPPCVRHVSASCPPCVCLKSARPRLQTFSNMCPLCPPFARHCVHFGRASKPCLQFVRLAFRLPCVGHVSALCPLCPRLQSLSAMFSLRPPCVRPCLRVESALAAPPNFVRHVLAMRPSPKTLSATCVPCWPVSALCPLWPRLQTLSAMWPPCHLSTSPLKPALPLDFVGSQPAVASSAEFFCHNCATHSVYMACPLTSFLHIPQVRPLQVTLCLQNCLGSMLV